MSDLTSKMDDRQNGDGFAKNRVFYRCEKPDHPVFALTEDGVITSGLTLVHYYSDEFDFVDEEISTLGAEAMIMIPSSMEAGAIYEAKLTNIGRDWESGHIDSYDIEFSVVTDSDELSRIASLRESAEAEVETEEFIAFEEGES